MEIKERIGTCLADIERKQQSVDLFQAKVRQLIDSLKAGGMTPGAFSDLLSTLESILKDYSEISANCRQMIDGLQDIEAHLDRIEKGRRKILTGVEAILQNLSHLDRLAKNGVQVGASTGGKKPKRILLVRISPDKPAPSLSEDEDEDDEGPAGDTVVH